jgi:O-antigen biosynthesis protein
MAPEVCVGIPVHADPEALVRTLRFLEVHTRPGVEFILLPDGPDAAVSRALRADPAIARRRQWATSDARGTAACFNRLAGATDASVVVLVESGSLVGPMWLELILDALDRPGVGLAGPSTNTSWNDQAVFPRARGDLESVRGDAASAFARFGRDVRPLEPLHSLNDFCYAVRREVIDTIGAADEAYGLGPCWEMDYNVRAARACLRGLWVCGAYVYRGSLTLRRRAEEAARHEASRRLYQDRFCGLRLRAQATDYQLHCLGDACEHFAPANLLQIHRPLGRTHLADHLRVTSVAPASSGSAGRLETHAADLAPLVSCVMPTRGRARFAARAIDYFRRQDYPRAELVVIDAEPRSLSGPPPDDPRIRVLPAPAGRSIGALRNDAVAAARGAIVVLWDDDDWNGPGRVSRQVAPILAGDADMTALRDVPVFDIGTWQCWRWTPDLHRRMLALDVLGGTLAFRRSVWEQLTRYPDASLAEDAEFVRRAVAAGARLVPIDGSGLYVYIRHGRNSWQLDHGESLDPAGWRFVDEPAMESLDRVFYRSFLAAGPVPGQWKRGSEPVTTL